mmetsp:Transcript_13556/g.39008  ORF Transcript_13556/g.39008 Transcript_13556/m.39008 type:complete len:210 (-) Transcript_13556:858-1487(-)
MTTNIHDICRPREDTDWDRVSDCRARALKDRPLRALALWALTSATFLCTTSNFCRCVAVSLTKARRSPTTSCFKAATPSPWLLTPSLPKRMRASVCNVLQSVPRVSTREVRLWICASSRSSSGFAWARCSPSMDINLDKCSVCDFWSTKWRFSSVSICLYASWICAETSFMSSPIEVSSKLTVLTSARDTMSGETVPGAPVPLQAVKPM